LITPSIQGLELAAVHLNTYMKASVTVIIPAGREDPKPCWLRTHPNGNLVIVELLRLLDLTDVHHVIVATTTSHVERWCAGSTAALEQFVQNRLPAHVRFEIFMCSRPTAHAADTVATVIRSKGVSGPLFIKDQDGSFAHKVQCGNYVVGMRVTESCQIDALPTKSFIEATGSLLSSIHEKKIVSDMICVGGYGFESSADFLTSLEHVEALHRTAKTVLEDVSSLPPIRIFISHVVQQQLLLEGKVFAVDLTDAFFDWKTDDGWRRFCKSYRNVEVSLEGVLFINERAKRDVVSAYLDEPDMEPISANIAYLRHLDRSRTHITLRTSRAESSRRHLERLLAEHGVPYDCLICSSLHATTFVVGAYGEDVPHPSSVSHAFPEGAPQLGQVLHFH
jgi:hypothetical protein